MTIYLILIFLAAALGVPMCGAVEKKHEKGAAAYCILFALAFTAIASVRLDVGHDYNLYAGWFYDFNFMDFDEVSGMRREKGLLIPMKLLNIAESDYPAAFGLISLMIYPPLMAYIGRYSDNPWISVLSFLGFGVFFNSMNFMSQFIAAVICIYAFKYAEKGCPWRFTVLVLLAFCFHRSAIVVLPCLLFAYIEFSGRTLAVLSVITAVLYVLSGSILSVVTQYVYTGYNLESNVEITNGLPLYYTVMFGVVFAAGFLLRNRLSGEKEGNRILLWCAYAAFFFELIGSRYAIVSRFAVLFFIPAVTILVPRIFKAVHEAVVSRKGKKAAAAAVIAAALLITVNYGVLLGRNYNGAVPYQTVFGGGGRNE